METGIPVHYTEQYGQLMAKGADLTRSNELDRAIQIYHEAINLAPSIPDAYYELGMLHHGRGETSEAIRLLNETVERNAEDAFVFNNLGVLYYHAGLTEKALLNFQRAIEIDPAHVEALFNWASANSKQKNYQAALSALTKCLELDPDFEKGRRLLNELGSVINLTQLSIPLSKQEKLSRLMAKERIRIRVLTHAETERDLSKRMQWGDYWVKYELEREFIKLGFHVVQENPDVILYLFGVPVNGLSRDTYNIAWVYSHPDMVTTQNLKQFDKLFTLSPSYADKLRQMGYEDTNVMISATSKKPLQREKRYDIVFVGNSRGMDGRRIVRDVGHVPYNFKVWGRGWDLLLPEKYYGGPYFDYEKLSDLYASSLISLEDHHPDMAREGFVDIKVFDILAGGGFAISDRNPGIGEIFGDAVPQYESPGHLRELLDYYITNPDRRTELMMKGRKIALAHNWKKRAEQFAGFLGFNTAKRTAFSLPGKRGPEHREGGKPKVLYVDVLSAAHAACNVNGMIKAYARVSDLTSFDYRGLAFQHGIEGMNRMLLETAVELRPDLIHLGKSESILGKTIKQIKDRIDTYIIHFYGDFRWDPQPWVVDIGRHVDCTLFSHTDERILDKYSARGVKNISGWWDAGTDPEIFHPRDVERTEDVVFMGNNLDIPHDGYDKRRGLIEAILKQGLDVHIYGGKWEYLRDAGFSALHLHPFVTEEEFALVCSRGKIILGINGVNNIRMYASWRRAVNSMASGAFHLTHYVPGMEAMFENHRHLVWFNSIPEAIQLIRYYLTHEEKREEIAKAGRREVLASQTWDARIAEMINRWREAGASLQPPLTVGACA